MPSLQAIRPVNWRPAIRLLAGALPSIAVGCAMTLLGAACIVHDGSDRFPVGVVLLYPAIIDVFHLGPFPRHAISALVLTGSVWSVLTFVAWRVLTWRRGSLVVRGVSVLLAIVLCFTWELQPGRIDGCWNLRPTHPCLCDEPSFVLFDNGQVFRLHGLDPKWLAGRYSELARGVYRLEWNLSDASTFRVFRHIVWTSDFSQGIDVLPRMRMNDEVQQIVERATARQHEHGGKAESPLGSANPGKPVN
jgi:hypothetical protein